MAEYNHVVMPEIHISRDRESLTEDAAELFAEIAGKAQDRFSVALAGGSTPEGLYRSLASERFNSRIDWQDSVFLIGDERDVPADSPESNFRMAAETMLQPMQVPDNHILRWRTELAEPEITAQAFELCLKNAFAADDDTIPRIDLVVLGLGTDAHTASLFPHTDALWEDKRLAVENRVTKLDTWRYTITFPLINNAANVVFLVSGDDKAEAVHQVIEGEYDPDEFPAQNVDPEDGRLIWMLDEAASRLLDVRRS